MVGTKLGLLEPWQAWYYPDAANFGSQVLPLSWLGRNNIRDATAPFLARQNILSGLNCLGRKDMTHHHWIEQFKRCKAGPVHPGWDRFL